MTTFSQISCIEYLEFHITEVSLFFFFFLEALTTMLSDHPNDFEIVEQLKWNFNE